MGCLVAIIGMGLMGWFGFDPTEDWMPIAGLVLLFAGLCWPSDSKSKSDS